MSEVTCIAHVNLARGFRGGERQTVLLIDYLKKAQPNLKQYLVVRPGSEIPAYVKQVKDLEIIYAKGVFSGHGAFSLKPNVVQCHEAKAAQWGFIHYLLHKTPYVITRRVTQTVRDNLFNRGVYKNASAISCVSNAIWKYVEQSFKAHPDIVKNKGIVIHSTLSHMQSDDKEVSRLKKKYAGKFVIGNIGALVDEHKGQKVMIQAVKEFTLKHPNCEVLFLGDGKDEAEFKALSKDIPQIEFLGFKKNVADYLDILDLFVFPSRYEGLGSVLLDVIDHKVPIIASGVDGILDIVENGKTGVTFENGNSQDLLLQMERLYQSPKLRDELVKNAYASLDGYTPEYMAGKYYALYSRL